MASIAMRANVIISCPSLALCPKGIQHFAKYTCAKMFGERCFVKVLKENVKGALVQEDDDDDDDSCNNI